MLAWLSDGAFLPGTGISTGYSPSGCPRGERPSLDALVRIVPCNLTLHFYSGVALVVAFAQVNTVENSRQVAE